MKYQIPADQKSFFEKNQYIEFEGLVKQAQLATLQKCKERGRDISRKNHEVKKIVQSALFAKIAKELFLLKALRFGYDELYELPLIKGGQVKGELPKGELTGTLFEKSSVSPLVAAVMICISNEAENLDSSFSTPPPPAPFAQKPGNVIFFSPTLIWDFEALCHCAKQKYLLIAYANSRALYIHQEKDPYMHTLKAHGYVFGDRLKETYHPTLGR